LTPRTLIEPARHAGTALLRSQSDERLVDLTRSGNDRAFEAIVHRYRRPLLRYCSRLLPPARSEDAVQQAFVSAHRSIVDGDAELNLRPWLYRIAHNASLNLLRQNGWDHDQVSEEIDGVETPPQAFERGERLRTVVAAVRELPDRQRDALVLRAVEGRSYDEIATELGVTGGAVRQLLNRARTTLRDGASALTPWGLLSRVSGGDGSVAERIAQTVAGAGGGAAVVKLGATVLVASAVAGGATGALPVPGAGRDDGGSATAQTAPRGAAGGADIASSNGGATAVLDQRSSGGGAPGTSGPARRGAEPSGGKNDDRHGGRGGDDSTVAFVDDRGHGDHDHSGRGDDDGGGHGSGGGDDRSGHGDGGPDDSDHSGHGGAGSSDDNPSGDDTSAGSDSSGGGSDDDEAGPLVVTTSPNSGSGSSGSGGGGDDEVDPLDDDHSGSGKIDDSE
jgi:RNA polymerase sigma factor (sigma-70 family)